MTGTTLKASILDYSRQATIGPLSPWFDGQLDRRIADGSFATMDQLRADLDGLLDVLRRYAAETGVGTAVIGLSGGVDSALTAAILKRAGWRVEGYTLPIEQNPDETARGVAACEALGVGHTQVDLTEQYHSMVAALEPIDPALADTSDEVVRIRRGNLRARLRMITLYDQARRHGGLVASTDNFSELSAGFWTINGDVGDLAPVQSLLKSWEVPRLAHEVGVPESIWRATPTDGLGISSGDEAQIGSSYLEWDLMVLALMRLSASTEALSRDRVADALKIGADNRAPVVLDNAMRRLGGTWFKRLGTVRLDHPREDRFGQLDRIDRQLFVPEVLR